MRYDEHTSLAIPTPWRARRRASGVRNLALFLCSISAGLASFRSVTFALVPSTRLSNNQRRTTLQPGDPGVLMKHKPFFWKRETSRPVATRLSAKVSPLPRGISPFEKSTNRNVAQEIRTLAAEALSRARGTVMLGEIDYPPYLALGSRKTQFDDLDNIRELDTNRDWCIQFVTNELPKAYSSAPAWLVFPDDKEVELAKLSWPGAIYQNAAKYTSLRAACEAVSKATSSSNSNESQIFRKAWGATFASTMNKVSGGDGILADSSKLDSLDAVAQSPRIHIVCQPGNGGPVEDWINVEQLHKTSNFKLSCPTIVVNGALDKVRDGYYPALFFPALSRTVPFYREFEAIFVLKPIIDKGLYGWLYRVYPEPWQVVLQTPSKTTTASTQQRPGPLSSTTTVQVANSVALVSEKRPSYAECVNALLRTSTKIRA
jgi:Domain of unknown function (DUF1995)